MPSRILTVIEHARIQSLSDRFKPKALAIVDAINLACEREQCQILVVSGRRDLDEQLEIWSRGRELIDPHGNLLDAANWKMVGQVATRAPPGSSPHNYGEAHDVVLIGHGRKWLENADPRWKRIVGTLVEQRGCVWGGRFRSMRDSGHFEHPLWKDARAKERR